MLVTQGPKPRAAVLGSPIEHSLSPVIHLAAYAHLGLDWGYERVELQPEGFVGFVDALDDTWRGLSVTMPLKEQAAVCGVPDADVSLTGAANTVVPGPVRHVYNTDIVGLMDALRVEGLHELNVATIIGNGPDALTRVTMIGNDLQLDSGVGTCGKEGQSVPVGVGQPTLRIDGLTVGGTA